MLRSGLLSEVMPGLYEWRGDYDEVRNWGDHGAPGRVDSLAGGLFDVK